MGIVKAFMVAFVVVAATSAVAQSPAHEAVKKRLAELRAMPEKARLPAYLPSETDFDDVCTAAGKSGKVLLVSIGREACGRCQVFYEQVRRGEVSFDGSKVYFVRLSIDDESQRSYFMSTFIPDDSHLPFVGVMNGAREALSPCLSGSHPAADYVKAIGAALGK